MKQKVKAVYYDGHWVLEYVNRNGYVATTWTGPDHFTEKSTAEHYAIHHYRGKLTL